VSCYEEIHQVEVDPGVDLKKNTKSQSMKNFSLSES
jgi:hypothetical protein